MSVNIKWALWFRKYAVVITAFSCIPIYFFTNQTEGYHIVAGLLIAWSVEQIFVYSGIDKLKSKKVEGVSK